MQIKRVFYTSSSPRYLERRTVSLPTNLVMNSKPQDIIRIVISTSTAGNIEFELDGQELTDRAVLKTKNDRKFFVLTY
jgi:hypothetical protein